MIKYLVNKKWIGFVLWVATLVAASAQTNIYSGSPNRIVVFARFNGDAEMDTPRSYFEDMFNGETNSLRAYFKSVSNNKLIINSLMFPVDQGSYEMKYPYFCYDSSWKGSYPVCKGNDITSLYDINIGFILKELSAKITNSGNVPDASALDVNNDGYVDNFVIVFRGAGRGPGKGIYTPQTGTVSTTFTTTNGEITLNGKIIKNYTITYERNSLDTHCRFLLSSLGFPAQYRNLKSLPRSTGQWDPMDGPLLSLPLVYNRMKYSQSTWIENIPQITEPGVYTLSEAGHADNNAYKILSSNANEFWVLEYRDKTNTWDKAIPESGLIIYRVNSTFSGSVGANAEIYLYRKNGTPTVSGDIADAPFSDNNGRTTFNNLSNPYSFLTDGTISDDVDISDIRFQGDKMTFKVNKVIAGVENLVSDSWKVFANHPAKTISVTGEGASALTLSDMQGRLIGSYNLSKGKDIDTSSFVPGIYIARLSGISEYKVFKVIIK